MKLSVLSKTGREAIGDAGPGTLARVPGGSTAVDVAVRRHHNDTILVIEKDQMAGFSQAA